jgi:hypothetical protein
MNRVLLAFLLLCGSLYAVETDFESLMGKQSKHWEYVKQREDMLLLNQCKTLYEKNIQLLATPSSQQKIPKIIHFIWLGPKPFPPQSVENVRTWIAHHPDWRVKYWTDRERSAPCNGMERLFVKDFTFKHFEAQYNQSDNYGEKSDLLRYEILQQEGGVYADHDANCLQSFAPLHNTYDLYCCFETPHPAFVGRNITCGNGVIGSKPAHPVIAKVISHIEEHWKTVGDQFKSQDVYSKKERVLHRTYIALTHAVKESLEQDGNTDIVLPAAYFFAKQGVPSLYSKHFYATAWADDKIKSSDFEKTTGKLLHKVQKNMQHLYLALIIVVPLSCLSMVILYLRLRRRHDKR